MKEPLYILCRKFLNEALSVSGSDLLIVAISGGLDSVVLTHLLRAIGQPILLAHCNFQLRGFESERDEAFVQNLAKDWKIPLQTRKFDTEAYAEEQKISIQLAARQLRYEFFEEVRLQLSGQGKKVWIATAHHANDSVETVLMNFFRGTGIDGLRGIPAKNEHVVRPLLFARREDLEEYAREKQLSWVEDSSNEQQDYTRNYIRHTILPAIERQYPSVLENIQNSSFIFRDVASLFHEMVAKRLKRLVLKENGIEKVPVLKVLKMEQTQTILYEWVKGFGFTKGQLGEVMKLTEATNGSYISSGTHRIVRNRAWLVMAPVLDENNPIRVVDSLPFSANLMSQQKLFIQPPQPYDATKGIPALPGHEVWLDAEAVELPLIIRPWKHGDYFYPLGMRKKKKVSRFLIDSKVSPLEKENIMVVESKSRIIWLIGYRIDDRFKIVGPTKNIIKMIAGFL